MTTTQPSSPPRNFSAPQGHVRRDISAIDLVPLSTHLIPPSLAEAFNIPLTKAAAGTPLGQGDAGKGQTKSSDGTFQRQVYGVRLTPPGGAQPMLPPNYFPNNLQPGLQPQPPNKSKADSQNQVGTQQLTRQLQGLGMPNLQYSNSLNLAENQAMNTGAAPQYTSWLEGTPGSGSSAQNLKGPVKPSHDFGSDGENGEDLQARALKRPRLVWTAQLHQRFVDAVKQLGLKNAVPKTIMTLMNVDGLTRENVASHLQKYRLQLRKDEGRGAEDIEKGDDDDDKFIDIDDA